MAAIAVAFVGLALIKPWDAGQPTAPVTAGGSAAPSTAPDPTPLATGAARPALGETGSLVSTAPIRWAAAAAALELHDGWGVRALVDTPNADGGIRPAHAGLTERWEPAAPAIDGALGGSLAGDGAVSDAIVMPTGGEPVRALGVTAPPDRIPLEIRAWRLPGDGAAPRWLDVRPVDPNVAGGHLLLLPPRLPDGQAPWWPPGAYRFDLLLGTMVTRLTIILPHDGTLTGGAPFQGAAEDVVDPLQADLSGVPAGPFVVAGGVAIGVGAIFGPALDEAAAWLDVAATDDGTGAVAEVWLPGLNGIGQVLPVGARLEWAALERIAPSVLVGVDATARVLSDVRGRSSTVLFSPPRAEPWPAGTYALDARWTEQGSVHSGRWHVAILPGPARRTGAWTTLARGWARYAGAWGIVSGTAQPLQGGPATNALRLVRQLPGRAPGDPLALGPRCDGGALVDAASPVFGIAHPITALVRSVRAERLFVGGRALPQAIATSPSVVAGLSVVGPKAELPWPPGYYRLVAETADGDTSLVVCLGEVAQSGSSVDPATASAEAFAAAQMASTTK